MRKRIRQISAIIMSVLMISVTVVFAVGQEPNRVLSFSGTENAAFMEAINAADTNCLTTASNNYASGFSLNVSENTNGTYTGTGRIPLEGGNVNYCATGELSKYTLANGAIAYIGTINGEINNGSQLLSMTVHAIPEEEKTFVLVNISATDDAGLAVDNKVRAYGELFDEMNEFVAMYTADRDNCSAEDTAVDVTSVERAISVSDYNSKYVDTTIKQYGNRTGGYFDLIALSVFAPKAMKANGQHYLYAKVNSHNANAKQYARAFLAPGVVTGLTVDNGTVTMTAKKADIGFTSQNPVSKSVNVTIPVPVPSSTGVSLKTFTVPIIRVSAELKQEGNYNSNNTTNCAYWYFGGNNNISWSSSVEPKDTEKAFAGQGYITNFNNLSYESSCKIAFSGTLRYGYTSQFGTTQYAGSFNASASYDHTVKLAKTTS